MEKGKNTKNTYPVLGMSCASCAARVDKTILQSAVQDAGYDLLVDTGEDVTNKAEEIRLARYRKIKRRTVVALLLSLPIMVISMFF